MVVARVAVKGEGGLAACGEMPVPEIERPERVSTTLDQRGVVEPARQRKIIHIDMDAFYASVEQRDNSELRGKPVAVGGSRERGVVAAASYEARRFGIRSAMPSVTAKRKCPELIFVRPRFEVYRAVSHQIREIFAAYTPLVEPLSLDEAYLDVTENLKAMSSATEIAEQIRARIRSETELTASAGVSYNKFLAKMASDERKPDGLFVITPSNRMPLMTGKSDSRSAYTIASMAACVASSTSPVRLRVTCWKSEYLALSVTVRPRMVDSSQYAHIFAMSGLSATRASSRVKRSASNVVSAPMDLRMRSAHTGRSSMPRARA